MGQNDSRHKNLPPGYQNYDPQMINNYLAYQQHLNPHFFMQGSYQANGFSPEAGSLRQGELTFIEVLRCDLKNNVTQNLSTIDSKSNQNRNNRDNFPINSPHVTHEHSRYGIESPNNNNAEKIFKTVVQPKHSMLQELLECPICMNTYDNPHVLPCQHTFCKGCIVSLKNNDKTASENIW